MSQSSGRWKVFEGTSYWTPRTNALARGRSSGTDARSRSSSLGTCHPSAAVRAILNDLDALSSAMLRLQAPQHADGIVLSPDEARWLHGLLRSAESIASSTGTSIPEPEAEAHDEVVIMGFGQGRFRGHDRDRVRDRSRSRRSSDRRRRPEGSRRDADLHPWRQDRSSSRTRGQGCSTRRPPSRPSAL